MVKVIQITRRKDGKSYTNYYLVLENGTRIPIEVHAVKNNKGEIVNKYDYVKLNTIATKISSAD